MARRESRRAHLGDKLGDETGRVGRLLGGLDHGRASGGHSTYEGTAADERQSTRSNRRATHKSSPSGKFQGAMMRVAPTGWATTEGLVAHLDGVSGKQKRAVVRGQTR